MSTSVRLNDVGAEEWILVIDCDYTCDTDDHTYVELKYYDNDDESDDDL